ncbi:MAG: PhzF family phenazine biosynthesis isomerase [Lachnospiraceae bacterium]|nr:PhzF family phenazine biosynthesis isomerase [Lachnospiraceae bacterium]
MKQYVVDAFTNAVFSGNPAAICILEKPLPEKIMMSIALENNFSETAFAVKRKDCYSLRWFTPAGEIDLCGHATLAAAFVILNFYEKGQNCVTFETVNETLTVTEQIIEAIGAVPEAAYMGRDLLLHVTAPGNDADCISRTFAPKCGVVEDAVCGSGHCHIAPYWAKQLQKQSIIAYQASKRGGMLYCTIKGTRVLLSGNAALFSIAELFPEKSTEKEELL